MESGKTGVEPLAQSLRRIGKSGGQIYSTAQFTPGWRDVARRQQQPAAAGAGHAGLHPQPPTAIDPYPQGHRKRSAVRTGPLQPPLRAIPGQLPPAQ